MGGQMEEHLSDFVLPPVGPASPVVICSEDDDFVFTTLGIFAKPGLTWVVDPRYKLVRSARYDDA